MTRRSPFNNSPMAGNESRRCSNGPEMAQPWRDGKGLTTCQSITCQSITSRQHSRRCCGYTSKGFGGLSVPDAEGKSCKSQSRSPRTLACTTDPRRIECTNTGVASCTRLRNYSAIRLIANSMDVTRRMRAQRGQSQGNDTSYFSFVGNPAKTSSQSQGDKWRENGAGIATVRRQSRTDQRDDVELVDRSRGKSINYFRFWHIPNLESHIFGRREIEGSSQAAQERRQVEEQDRFTLGLICLNQEDNKAKRGNEKWSVAGGDHYQNKEGWRFAVAQKGAHRK